GGVVCAGPRSRQKKPERGCISEGGAGGGLWGVANKGAPGIKGWGEREHQQGPFGSHLPPPLSTRCSARGQCLASGYRPLRSLWQKPGHIIQTPCERPRRSHLYVQSRQTRLWRPPVHVYPRRRGRPDDKLGVARTGNAHGHGGRLGGATGNRHTGPRSRQAVTPTGATGAI